MRWGDTTVADEPSLVGRTLGVCWITEQISVDDESMGTVYKAYDPDISRYVAIKVLGQIFAEDSEFLGRFLGGARLQANHVHPHIVWVSDIGEEDGIIYSKMPYLSGGTLRNCLRHGLMSLEEACRLVGQIATALDYIHRRNVVHRNVKPTTILFDADGDAHLTGFGAAVSAETPPDMPGYSIGVPRYMAPEQAQCQPTFPSDQYALGVVLYEMVTGRAPFMAETPKAVVQMHKDNPPTPPSDFRPDLPEAAEQVILRALAKKPGSRYKMVGKMAAAFADAIGESR